MALIWLGCAWLLGVALGPVAREWWPPALCGGLAGLTLAALYPERRRLLLGALVLLAVLALGAWRAGPSGTEPADLPPGAIEAARGTVVDWPERGNRNDRAMVAIDAVRVAGEWRGATARARADVPLQPAIGRGDRVELYGYYRPAEAIPLAGFRASLQRRGLHGQFRAFGASVVARGERDGLGARRVAGLDRLEESIRRRVPQPEAALVTGILLGDDGRLPKEQRQAFERTNTSHIMALSGWNIAIVAGCCALVGRRLGRARSWWWQGGSIAILWLYTGLVGGGASLMRAAIMGTLYLVAEATGRRGDALIALVVAATLMTAVAPATIFDLGFQLSCAATAGLVLCSGPLARALRRLPAPVAAGAAATLAAEGFTLPLVLHHFGQLSLVTLPANLLVEPLVPLVMAGSALTVAAEALWAPLGALAGIVAWLPARLLLFSVELLGKLAWATVGTAMPSPPVVAALYATLGAAIVAPSWLPALRVTGGRLREELAPRRPVLMPLLAGVVSGLVAGGWLALLLGPLR